MRRSSIVFLVAFFIVHCQAGQLDTGSLQRDLNTLAQGFDGRVGVCIQAANGEACLRAGERFPMQSVMKLLVGLAGMDAVDRQVWRLDETVIIHQRDLSLYVQPLAALVGPNGYRTTIGDLIRRAIIDSDSAAADILIARLGGPSAVQSVLRRKGIEEIRLDRDERHLQTEIIGIAWRPEYVDAGVLDRATASTPEAERDRAFAKYLTDPRDTSTPRAMASLLSNLGRGSLLSSSSTAYLLQAMKECATFPDRLKAGVSAGWEIYHKTGTSGAWKGVIAASNDVGILKAPDGTRIPISVFLADSKASSAANASLMARIAAAAIAHYR